MTIKTARPTADHLSIDQLAQQIRDAVEALVRRGAGRLAAETCAGELEDLSLATMGGEALTARAYALDRDLAQGEQVRGGIA
jgi:hypothetical protein